jgi:hypothetical protein
LKQASTSFLKKRSKKLFESGPLAVTPPTPSNVMAGLDPAIHAFQI